jgi:ABC-type branched-subunit amino acid transport system ATPase component
MAMDGSGSLAAPGRGLGMLAAERAANAQAHSSHADAALAVQGLTKRFDGLIAVNDVTIGFRRNAVTAIIGPNGAGKTTLFNVLSGLESSTSGRIVLQGREVTRWNATRRARAGMARTFQNNRLYADATVLENVLIACHDRAPGDSFEQARLAWAELEHLSIAEYANKKASELSIGMQRQLELARALARRPSVLLLDEPAAGLSAERIDMLTEVIRGLARRGVTIVLIEHRLRLVREVADTTVVMDRGTVIAEGRPDTVMNNEAVRRAYVGNR